MAAAEVEVAAAGLDAEDTTPDNTDEVTSQQKEQQEPEVKSTQPQEPEPEPEPEPVSYPIKVIYCGECTMPLEYCEFHPDYEKCKKWLEKNLPEQFEAMMRLRGDEDETSSEKKKQKRGGRGIIKTRKKTAPQRITISRMQRNKRKYVTVVKGLSTCDIDLKVASKYFASHFSCGSSVTGDDEIVIQGDVTYEIQEAMLKKWKEIDEDMVEDLGDQKR